MRRPWLTSDCCAREKKIIQEGVPPETPTADLSRAQLQKYQHFTKVGETLTALARLLRALLKTNTLFVFSSQQCSTAVGTLCGNGSESLELLRLCAQCNRTI
jgi:hypothetical protein